MTYTHLPEHGHRKGITNLSVCVSLCVCDSFLTHSHPFSGYYFWQQLPAKEKKKNTMMLSGTCHKNGDSLTNGCTFWYSSRPFLFVRTHFHTIYHLSSPPALCSLSRSPPGDPHRVVYSHPPSHRTKKSRIFFSLWLGIPPPPVSVCTPSNTVLLFVKYAFL